MCVKRISRGGAGWPAKAADQSIHIRQAKHTMHTTIIIAFGLILLTLMLYIGEKIGFPRQVLAYSFIVLWLHRFLQLRER